ncbi:MAG: hypothetical protein ACRD2A_20875, partial [Vicinamibacterales bacterium]
MPLGMRMKMPARGLLVAAVVLLAGVFVTGQLTAVIAFEQALDELDDAPIFDELDAGPQASVVFDRHGKPAFTFHIEQRISV